MPRASRLTFLLALPVLLAVFGVRDARAKASGRAAAASKVGAVQAADTTLVRVTAPVQAVARRQRWEYTSALADRPDAMVLLNRAGADGWELVAVATLGGAQRFLLKRPTQ